MIPWLLIERQAMRADSKDLRMFASVRTIFEVTNKEGVVKIRSSIYSAAALCLLLTISGITLGQGNVPEKLKDAADESAKAAEL